jgi:hypothetical protein
MPNMAMALPPSKRGGILNLTFEGCASGPIQNFERLLRR